MNRKKIILAIFGIGGVIFSGCSTLPKAVVSDPLTPEEYNTLGQVYVQKNEKQAAIRQYEAALRKDRKNIPALIALGNLAFEEKDYPNARRYFQRVLKVKPGDASGVNNLAMVDLAEGKNLEQAVARLEAALPNAGKMRPYILDTLANIAIQQNRLQDAKSILEMARKEAPPTDEAFLKNLALTEKKLPAETP